MASLSKVDRHHRILEVLAVDQRALLPDLEELIEASRITIQRDLVELEERGLIRRFHGGAMLSSYDLAPLAHSRRMSVNRDAKRRLAAVAARQIKPDTFVGLDASSTIYHISDTTLPGGVTVVNSGLDTFVNLQATNPGRGIQPIVTGGRFQPETHTLVGPDAIRAIGAYHYEAFFFSAYSVIAGGGVYEYSEENTEVKRTFVERSDRRILVLDQSKFGQRGGVRICGLDEVDLVITDGRPDTDLAEILGDRLVII
jgi:DeoR/GlpR family transcriptional regulator of sugar metabolism